MWKSPDVKNFIVDSSDKITQQRMQDWDSFLEDLFDEMFEEGFVANNEDELRHIIYVLRDQANFAVFDFIMRKYIEIDTEGLDLNTIPEKINNFINDYFSPIKSLRREVNAILFGNYKKDGVINPEHIKARFFNLLAVTFFADPRTDRMVIPRKAGKFFGFNKEAMYFFYYLPLVIAELFAKEGFKLEDFYSNIQYSFDDNFFTELNNKLLNGIDISGIFPESSRWPDLNVYEFLSTVISSHMKSTHLQDFTTYHYADMIRADGLSGLILDYYRQVMNDKETVPHHILELIIPIKDRSEALDTFNRLIRMRPRLEQDFEETLYNLYYGSSFKVPEQHVYLFKVTQLLNEFIQLDQRQINSISELRQFIEDIFDDPDSNIYYDLLQLVYNTFKKEDKLDFILSQGVMGEEFFHKIRDLFTDENNLLKLTIPDDYSNNRLKLSWGAYIDFWFDTNEQGEKVQFRSSFLSGQAIFLLEKGGKKRLPSDAVFKEAMVVVHYVDDRGNGHNGICSTSEVDSLPKKYQEGVWLRDDVGRITVLHNVYVCNDAGFQLFGKVIIDKNGEFAINPNDKWTLRLLEAQEGFLRRNNKDAFKRFSRLQNGDVDIYSTHFFTAVGYATGNKYISTLQETTVNIVSNPPYKTYLPSADIDTKGDHLESTTLFDRNELLLDYKEIIFNRIKSIVDNKYRAEVQAISNTDLEFLNLVRGNPGHNYDSISRNIKLLLGDDNGYINYDNFNHKLYKILSIEPNNNIKDTKFRKIFNSEGKLINPTKAWFRSVFEMFQDFPLSRDLYISNLIKEFDLKNRFFSEEEEDFNSIDSILAQDLLKLMVHLFGSYTVQMMITGQMIIRDDIVSFISYPYSIYRDILVSIGVKVSTWSYPPFGSSGRLDSDSIKNLVNKYVMESLIYDWVIKIPSQDSSAITLGVFRTMKSKITSLNIEKRISGVYFNSYNSWYIADDYNYQYSRYSQLINILSIILEQNINIQKDSLIRDGLSERRFSTYKDLAIKNLRKFISTYSELNGDIFRENLFNFLLSRGAIPLRFDLYLADSFSRVDKANIPPVFYTLSLYKDAYIRWFGDDSFALANSIPSSVEVEPYRIILEKDRRTAPIIVYPDTYFNSFQGKVAIIEIAEFLKEIANNYGKLRIYGYSQTSKGFGFLKRLINPYHPTSQVLIDPLMPAGNDRYFELNPSNNFQDFSTEGFKMFLGALLADNQLFIVRTESMRLDPTSENQILFAFCTWRNKILPVEIFGHEDKRYTRPVTPSQTLSVYDDQVYEELATHWSQLLNRISLIPLHRFNEFSDWIDYCDRVHLLNVHISMLGH